MRISAFPSLSSLTCALALVAALAGAPAQAMDPFDLPADLLLMQANALKVELRLNANQQTLWTQATGKAETLLRERARRRGRLKEELKAALATPSTEPRTLNRRLEAEAAQSAAETAQLRELLLSVTDALDDEQRALVLRHFAEQLDRRDDGERRAPMEGGRGRGGPGGSMHGGGPGGMGGGGRGGMGF